MGLLTKLDDWARSKSEARIRKAAELRSPVEVEVDAEARNRYTIFVNGRRIYVEIKQFIAFKRARFIEAKLKEWGYDVLPSRGL